MLVAGFLCRSSKLMLLCDRIAIIIALYVLLYYLSLNMSGGRVFSFQFCREHIIRLNNSD
jgi:hypothetical protein